DSQDPPCDHRERRQSELSLEPSASSPTHVEYCSTLPRRSNHLPRWYARQSDSQSNSNSGERAFAESPWYAFSRRHGRRRDSDTGSTRPQILRPKPGPVLFLIFESFVWRELDPFHCFCFIFCVGSHRRIARVKICIGDNIWV